MPTILCYGDSNTWGSCPHEPRRYDRHERWPGVLRDTLGDGFWVVEEGLGGRTTVWDDPVEDQRNGESFLQPCLDSHQPDLVILLLGTNDLKHRFGLSPWDIASGAGKLASIVRRNELRFSGRTPELILVCPPPIIETGVFANMFEGGAAKSLQLAPYYQAVARDTGAHFVDAGTLIRSAPGEGIHWDASEHRILGLAMAAKVREVLS